MVCGTILVVFLNTIRVKLDDNEFRAFHKRLINEPCCHSANLAFYKTCNTVFENFSAALPSRNDGSFLHKISTGIAKLTTSETAKNSLLDQENALLRDCPGFGIKRYDADVDDAEALGRLLEMAVLPPSDFDSMRKEHLWDGVASRWQKAVRKKTPTNVVDTLRVLLRSRTASLGREPYLPFMTT
ncbi:MAG: hypothetical protein GY822_29025 [Deltaproteobacteria bacterium]|nr:hypothetical protein [Deltaproteobacteria bacterium]